MKNTILIADDHKLVRETWSYILNTHPSMEVICECGNGEDAVEKAKTLKPDIVIMDINLPGIDGIEATEKIRRYSPDSKILAVSLHTQPSYARRMMQNGASGYVTKNSSREEMFQAIETVLTGEKYICQEIKHNLAEQLLGENNITQAIKSLSRREMEIISRIKIGLSSKEIGEQLSISAKTVEVHRYNILKKLNLKNTAALVNYINTQKPEIIHEL